MFTVSLESGEAEGILKVLDHFYGDQSLLMHDIGQYVTQSTRERIMAGGPGPDGTPWAAKSPVTIANYFARREGMDSRPLIHLGVLVGPGLGYQSGEDFAEISASPEYAATMQFGAKRGVFGAYSGTAKNGRRYSGVTPWGDIPARPYLGISSDDEEVLQQIVSEHVAGQIARWMGS